MSEAGRGKPAVVTLRFRRAEGNGNVALALARYGPSLAVASTRFQCRDVRHHERKRIDVGFLEVAGAYVMRSAENPCVKARTLCVFLGQVRHQFCFLLVVNGKRNHRADAPFCCSCCFFFASSHSASNSSSSVRLAAAAFFTELLGFFCVLSMSSTTCRVLALEMAFAATLAVTLCSKTSLPESRSALMTGWVSSMLPSATMLEPGRSRIEPMWTVRFWLFITSMVRASEMRKKEAPPPRAAKLRALQGDGAVWGRMDSYRPSAYATALMFLNATPPILA